MNALYTVKPGVRAYTYALLDLVEQGGLNKDQLITELLFFLSEDVVMKFCKTSPYLRDEDNEQMIRREDE